MCALALLVALPGPLAGAAGGDDPPVVMVGYADGPLSIFNGPGLATVASLPVPTGRWAVIAKAFVQGTGEPAGSVLTCRLVAGGDSGETVVFPSPLAQSPQLVVLGVVHEFTSEAGGRVRLRCAEGTATTDLELRFLKITAYKAGRLDLHDLDDGTLSTSGPDAGVPRVSAAQRVGPVSVRGGTFRTVAALPVIAGRWAASATLDLRSATSDGPRLATCRLVANDARDVVAIRVGEAGFDTDRLGAALATADAFPARGSLRLQCRSDGFAGDVLAHNVRVTAMRVGRLTEVALSSGSRTSTGSGIPTVVHGASSGPFAVAGGSTLATLSALHLPAGDWAVLGKVWFTNTIAAARTVTCELQAEGDFDRTTLFLLAPGQRGSDLGAAFAVAHSFGAGGGDVFLQCATPAASGDVIARQVRITAVKAGSLTNTPLEIPVT